MTVALSDTMLLCDMLRPLPDFSDSIATAEQTHAFYTRRKPLSATINTLANALYQVRLPLATAKGRLHSVPGASSAGCMSHVLTSTRCLPIDMTAIDAHE